MNITFTSDNAIGSFNTKLQKLTLDYFETDQNFGNFENTNPWDFKCSCCFVGVRGISSIFQVFFINKL